MIIYVDIDNTICNTPPSADYTKAKPIYERIAKINSLYDQGHTIVYWTARGTRTGTDWRELTEQQLSKWLVKYHELKLGKPVYDLFIDDRNINSRGTSMADAKEMDKVIKQLEKRGVNVNSQICKRHKVWRCG